MVGPTKEKPQPLSALLRARDSSVWAGRSARASNELRRGCAAHERPEEGVEGAVLGLHGERRLCAGDGCVDLGAVADDAGVGAEAFAVGVVVGGDGGDVEAVEGGAVALAPVEDGAPRKSRLRPFEHEQLEERAVAVRGDTPLLVVVALHEGVVAGPLAAGHGFGHWAGWYRGS